MATLELHFELTVSGGPITAERIAPNNLQVTVGDQAARKVLDVPDGVSVMLDPGDITPRRWFVMNVHATVNLLLSFGAADDDLAIPPGEFSWFQSTKIPTVRGDAAASKVMYGVYAA